MAELLHHHCASSASQHLPPLTSANGHTRVLLPFGGNYGAKKYVGGGCGNFPLHHSTTPRNIASIIFNQKLVIDDCDDWLAVKIYPVLNFLKAAVGNPA